MQVISNRFLHLVKTDFAFDKKQPLAAVSVHYFIFLYHKNDLWI